MATSPDRPLLTTWLPLVAGVLLLAAMVAFVIGLPKLSGAADEEQGLPGTLPGGWTAIETGPDADDPDNAAAVGYVNDVLGRVYDEPTEFAAYVSDAGDALVTVTLFDAEGGAFAPPNGVADPEAFDLTHAPIELTRNGGAVCIANYQSAAIPGQPEGTDSDQPVSVSCQAPSQEATMMLSSTGMTVDATADLLLETTRALADAEA